MSFADILSRETLPLNEVKVSSDSSNVLDGLSLSMLQYNNVETGKMSTVAMSNPALEVATIG